MADNPMTCDGCGTEAAPGAPDWITEEGRFLYCPSCAQQIRRELDPLSRFYAPRFRPVSAPEQFVQITLDIE